MVQKSTHCGRNSVPVPAGGYNSAGFRTDRIIDDFLLWLFILWYLSDELDRYWLGDKSVDLSKKYKDTVDDVNYTVEEDKGGPQSGS